METEKTIERKVADAILQQPIQVEAGGKIYDVAPPSVATLILASEAAARMPQMKLDKDRIIEDTLAVARYCRPIGEFAAILILGAKRLKDTREIEERTPRRVLGFIRCGHRTIKRRVEYDAKAELAERLLEDLSPKDLYQLIARMLQQMQVGDFFGVTTFLTEINLIRPTKVEETTASGR